VQFSGAGWCCCDDLRTTVEAAAMVVKVLEIRCSSVFSSKRVCSSSHDAEIAENVLEMHP
jgi:hypothetical protein